MKTILLILKLKYSLILIFNVLYIFSMLVAFLFNDKIVKPEKRQNIDFNTIYIVIWKYHPFHKNCRIA